MPSIQDLENRARTFFLGAGASKAAGYPLSSELIAGIADAVCGPKDFPKVTRQEVTESERIRDYMFTIYGATAEDLCKAARHWQAIVRGENPDASARQSLRSLLPDLTDILSAIDILTQEDLSVGPYHTQLPIRFNRRRVIDARELRAVRRSFSRALANSFNNLDDSLRASKRTLIDEFVAFLGPRDSVITSNWDILVDRALHGAFGTAPKDYGTEVRWLRAPPEKVRSDRPPLLKLHGSMNWLQCRRCQTLFVDPLANVAMGDFDENAPLGYCKECSFKLTTLMVTPTFVKEYKSAHLGAVWNAALRALCNSSEWVFIGYSLPSDDVHIATMLVRAYRVWADFGLLPSVTIVNLDQTGSFFQRYRHLFPPGVSVFDQGFEAYLKEGIRHPPTGLAAGVAAAVARAETRHIDDDVLDAAPRFDRERRHPPRFDPDDPGPPPPFH